MVATTFSRRAQRELREIKRGAERRIAGTELAIRPSTHTRGAAGRSDGPRECASNNDAFTCGRGHPGAPDEDTHAPFQPHPCRRPHHHPSPENRHAPRPRRLVPEPPRPRGAHHGSSPRPRDSPDDPDPHPRPQLEYRDHDAWAPSPRAAGGGSAPFVHRRSTTSPRRRSSSSSPLTRTTTPPSGRGPPSPAGSPSSRLVTTRPWPSTTSPSPGPRSIREEGLDYMSGYALVLSGAASAWRRNGRRDATPPSRPLASSSRSPSSCAAPAHSGTSRGAPSGTSPPRSGPTPRLEAVRHRSFPARAAPRAPRRRHE